MHDTQTSGPVCDPFQGDVVINLNKLPPHGKLTSTMLSSAIDKIYERGKRMPLKMHEGQFHPGREK